MSLGRTSTGLLFQESFASSGAWSGPNNWLVISQPTYVASPRSPIIALSPTAFGPDGGGIREGNILIDDDGTWWLHYGAGSGQSGGSGAWRIQYASSTDKGLSWTKHGYTDFGIQKTSTPADGNYGCRDMLYMEKRGSTYYLHAMSAPNNTEEPTNQVPANPLESDLFTGSSPSGPWTFVRRVDVVGPAGSFKSDYYCASHVVLSGGVYHLFSSAFGWPNLDYLYSTGYGTSTSPEGPWTATQLAFYRRYYDNHWQTGENPKVWFSDVLNKWVMVTNTIDAVNLVNGLLVNNITVYTGESVSDWTRNVYGITAKQPSPADGLYTIGLSSPFFRPEGVVVQTTHGYVPFTYDAEPVELLTYQQTINGHKLYYGVYEPSVGCAKHVPGTSVFSDDFNRSNRNIDGDNGWTKAYGSIDPAIVSNKLDMGSASGDVAVIQSSTLDSVALEATFTLGTNCSVGFVARYQDANNFYLLDCANNSGRLRAQLFKRQGGTYSLIGFLDTFWLWNAGDSHVCRVTVSGSTFSFYFDGVFITSFTDSTFTSGGSYGLRNGGAGTGTRLVDGFSVRNIASLPVTRFNHAVSNTNFVTEFAVSVDRTTGSAGLDYRIQSSGDSYRLVLTSSGLVLQKSTGGTGGSPGAYSSLATSSGTEVAREDFLHRIRLSVSGSTHQAWLDGEQQINHTDSAYTSGSLIALCAGGSVARFRNLHLRTADTITVNGLTNGQTITLRAPGQVPIATATVSGTSHTFTYTHYPVGGVEVDGTDYLLSADDLLWGGDVVTLTGAAKLFNVGALFNQGMFNPTHPSSRLFNTTGLFNRSMFNPVTSAAARSKLSSLAGTGPLLEGLVT